MILTPIDPTVLPQALETLARGLEPHPRAAAAFARIRAATVAASGGFDRPEHRAQARALCGRFGIPLVHRPPTEGFSYDGRAIWCETEASVLIHEVAHWQLCPSARRSLPDFGLGAGPETGRVDAAEAARCVGDWERCEEEALTSLLGILWEAELGQPALEAFLEQNWMDGWDKPFTPENLRRSLDRLTALGLLDDDARPLVAAVD